MREGWSGGNESGYIRQVVLDILERIAPDEDLSRLKDDVPLREQMELDSMDFLDIVMELRKQYRVQIPGRRLSPPHDHGQHRELLVPDPQRCAGVGLIKHEIRITKEVRSPK